MRAKRNDKQLKRRRESQKQSRLLRRDDHTNENVQRHNPRCRFCLQGNRDEGVRERLIVACACRNDGRYVHYQPCLGQHIETHMDRPCMICGQLFKDIRIERYKNCPTFCQFFKRAVWIEPNSPVRNYIEIVLVIQVVLLFWLPIPFATNHPNRPSSFKTPGIWVNLMFYFYFIIFVVCLFDYMSYLNTNPDSSILRYVWNSMRRYDEERPTFYYCMIALFSSLAWLILIKNINFVFPDSYRDVSEMDGLFVVTLNLIAVMVFFFAIHRQYLKFKRYHSYPHDMVRLRQWHGAINNQRIIDITDLKRQEARHIQALNRFQAMIQQTLEEIRMEEEPAVMEFLNWQLDWDNMTVEQKKEEEQWEKFVRDFFHYYLVRQRNNEWPPHLLFNDALTRTVEIMEEYDIPYDAMPFHLVIQDIVKAVPNY